MEIVGLIQREYVHTVIRKRPKDIHKGDCGKVLIFAGSKGMAGAAVLASKAAIKSGSGLVKVCTKRKLFPILQISVPEAICIPWGKVKKDLLQYDAIAIGPGMGDGKRTKKILNRILTEYDKIVVIDADGLNAIAGSKKLQQMVKTTKADVILTPHIGEAKRLLGNTIIEALTKTQIASSLIKFYGSVTVVKGADTLVAISGEEAYINTTGNPGMATAGSGDVLTGVIASFAGQGLSAADAAKTGVFVHGLSGDKAAETTGEYGLTASEIAEHVPLAIKELTD